jgi:flagellar hook assembly protein FlgD
MFRTVKAILLAILLFVCAGYVYAQNQAGNDDISINPNPMEKNTVITLTFAQKSNVEIVIETLDGTVVKTFYVGQVRAGNYEYYWSRYNDSGEYVPEGVYYVTIKYQQRYTSTKKTIILK